MPIFHYPSAVLFLALAAINGCQPDTCNKMATFENMSAKIACADTSIPCSIRISYQSKTDLPSAYFSKAQLSKRDIDYDGKPWRNDAQLIDKLQAFDNELVLTLSDRPYALKDTPWHFVIVLPDRRPYTNCQHAGNDDAYYIELEITATITNNEIVIQKFGWTETLSKGAI